MKKVASLKRNTNFTMFLLWIVSTALGIAVIGLAWKSGWVGRILVSDTLYISRLIAGTFVLAYTYMSWRMIQVSRELNIARSYVQRFDDGENRAELWQWLRSTKSRASDFAADYQVALPEDKALAVEILKQTLNTKIVDILYYASVLTMLGFFGTVVGMRLAIGAIDPNVFSDLAKVIPMIGSVKEGLAIAIDTTIVGLVFAIWLSQVYRVLRKGTAQLFNEILRVGLRNVR